MKNNNGNNGNDLFYGVFYRRGIRLVSAVDGSIHRPWMYSDGVVFTSPEAAANFAAEIGGDAEIWTLAAGRRGSTINLSRDVLIAREFAPMWAI